MCVYFMRNPSNGFIKIGKAKNVYSRKKQLESHIGNELELLGFTEGGVESEHAVQSLFDDIRISDQSEWFYETDKLLNFISAVSANGLGDITKEDRYGNDVKVSELKTDNRYRKMERFWLDISKEEQFDIWKKLDAKRKDRRYAPTIRNALKLFFSLEEGNTEILLKMFPDIFSNTNNNEYMYKAIDQQNKINEAIIKWIETIEHKINEG